MTGQNYIEEEANEVIASIKQPSAIMVESKLEEEAAEKRQFNTID